MNKSCKFCPYCDLIIGQKADLDELLKQILLSPPFELKLNPSDYPVFGTLERKGWAKTRKELTSQKDVIELVHPFKDILNFEIQPAGWYLEE